MEALERKKEITTEKKVQIFAGARLHDIKTITRAAATQDRIRQKVGKWQGAKEIKRWRNQAM